MKTPVLILLTALHTLLVLLPQAHSQQALQKKEYPGNHGNKVIVHYDPDYCIVREDTLYVIHRPTTLVLEMKPADKNWEYEEGKSTLISGEHPADPSTIPLGTEQELFPSEIASFHLTAKSTRDDIAINVVLVHVKAFVELPQGRTYCDGEINIPVHVKIQPEWLKDHTGSVELEFKSPEECDNPEGKCSKLSKKDEKGLKWEIDNARWFSTEADQCNDESTYIIVGSVAIHSADVVTEDSALEVSARVGEDCCLDGVAEIDQVWDPTGEPTYKTEKNKVSQLYETTITQGTFTRMPKATPYAVAMPNSQYLQMIIKEEIFHAKSQIENSEHYIYKKLWLAENIFDKLGSMTYMKFPALSESYSLQKAKDAFFAERFNEEIRSTLIIVEKEEEIELEAKNAAGSSHRVKFECTYKK